MKKFTELSNLLTDIKNTSRDVLSNVFELMSSLKNEDSEIVDLFLERLEDTKGPSSLPTRSEVLELLQNQSVALLGDSEVVNEEIDFFISQSDNGFNIDAQNEKCPYLSQVWNGDMYDLFELDGLNELLNEMKVLLSAENRDYLIQITIENLR